MHTEDFIDQLELEQARCFLRECHRILQPGGVIRVLTPDVEQLARLYLHEPGKLKALWRDHVGVPLTYGSAAEILNLGMRFAGHTFLYDAETCPVGVRLRIPRTACCLSVQRVRGTTRPRPAQS
jgi:predicted SAM-dependent methyltransferase